MANLHSELRTADLDSEQTPGQESGEHQVLDGGITGLLLHFGSVVQLSAGQRQRGSRNNLAKSVPKSTQSEDRPEDPVLLGFLGSFAPCHVERKQLALRIQARLVAVEMVLAGKRRTTLPEIAKRVGTSTRTLNIQFGVKDALFAFPPPELVPVLFDCLRFAGDYSELAENLSKAFRELDRNTSARSLLLGLARLHTRLPKLLLTDGYFNATLRSQIVLHAAVSKPYLNWTGYITDALRDSFQEWAACLPEPASLESIVPNLMRRLHPIVLR